MRKKICSNQKIKHLMTRLMMRPFLLRKNTKTKIQNSLVLLLENLNFINFYYNPKMYYVFQLIIEALIECFSYNSLLELN